VNEAARLCELAKADPGRVLAAWTAVEAAMPPVRQAWRPVGEVVAPGFPSPVPVARCVVTEPAGR
jgi:adenylate cyclase